MAVPRWSDDGRTRTRRAGLIVPHLDPVPETEMQAMLPPGASLHAARVPLGMIGPDGSITAHIGPDAARSFVEQPAMADAISLLAPLEPAAIAIAFTSSSYSIGKAEEARIAEKLADRANGIPVVLQCPAIVRALGELNVRRIALFHPPWFSDDLNDQGCAYFSAEGFDVAYCRQAKLRDTYGDIEPGQVFDWVIGELPEDAEAVVIGGGGFRSVGAIDALEAATNRPVVTANQALLWRVLRLGGESDRKDGYGRLFRDH